MIKHATSWPDVLSLSDEFDMNAQLVRKDGKLADLLEDALNKQHQFDRRRAAVEDLRIQLDDTCAAILEHGCNAERISQSRILEIGLLHARRQLELASQQLDGAIRHLRLVHGRKRGDEVTGQPETAGKASGAVRARPDR
jgi:hypothetical protein